MIYTRRTTPLHALVKECVTALKPHKAEFDFIAVRGVSGIAVGAPVAVALKVPVVIVRKPHENAHSSSLVEGWALVDDGKKRGLFLDDFVSMGETRSKVRSAVEKMGGKLVAQYEYGDGYRGWSEL